ncbi:hypothetical protein H2200_010611 [Cladophialophora chaetospira]|uniref:Transcription factor domain-containing protein n=1 Tax=Cladophialophora chaetospira TaxID=386627 RepID=A0AA38X1T0_9EURO|nr:hypothetical protein H2200_010611 [Cladophialophora chaetospira]
MIDFWSHAILQLSYRHGALQHFIVAISSLDELGRPGYRYAPFASPQSLYSFGLEQYGKAIHGVRQNSRPGSIELIASAVFCFILETWLGDLVAARTHACAALRFLQPEHVREVDGEARGLLTQYFRPMILRTCTAFTICSTLLRAIAQDTGLQRIPLAPANLTFATQGEARRNLDATSDFVLAEAKSGMAALSDQGLKIHLQQLRRHLEQWYHRLCQLDSTSGQKPSSWSQQRCHLELRYRYVTIGLMTLPLQDELLFDDFDYDFTALIDAAGSILKHASKANPGGATRSNDCSTMMALFFTVSSCRDPCIRRRALRLLYRYNRVESIFNSLAVGILGEQIMMLEEGSRDVKTASDVEAARRVRAINLKYDSGLLAHVATPPKMIITFTHPHGPTPHIRQTYLPFIKQWTGTEFVWSACSAIQTPVLLEEIANASSSSQSHSDAFEPEQRAVDFTLPVNHDLDSFWRMQNMDLHFNEEFLRRFPETLGKPAWRTMSGAIGCAGSL